MAIPKPALLLGWAGVIPFAFLAILTVLGTSFPVEPRFALLAYAATILSCMGGSQWGITARSPDGLEHNWFRYGVSVLPALVAWATVLAGGRIALLVLAAGFVVLLEFDVWTVRAGIAPKWYGNLRIQLKSAVVPLLLIACY